MGCGPKECILYPGLIFTGSHPHHHPVSLICIVKNKELWNVKVIGCKDLSMGMALKDHRPTQEGGPMACYTESLTCQELHNIAYPDQLRNENQQRMHQGTS